MVMRVASFFPFQTSYYFNGHSFIEQELKRAQIGFRKTDNAFLAVDDVAALQAAADKLGVRRLRIFGQRDKLKANRSKGGVRGGYKKEAAQRRIQGAGGDDGAFGGEDAG